MIRRLAVIGCLLVCGLPSTASAQEFGEIFGRVTDVSRAVMPNVSVTVSSPVLLEPIKVVTSATGSYRFPNLPIGTYAIVFELAGFRTVVRDGIRLEIGFSAQINTTMEVSAVEERVTVSGGAPIIDVRDTSTGARFTQEALQSLPSARDPWVVLEQTPGVRVDRENVGGNWSGQQSTFNVRASPRLMNSWVLDGVDVTDTGAAGAAPFFFDFDSFEEIRVTTGGSSGSMGVSVSIVTKSGSDQLKGSLRGYLTDGNFQANNVSDAMRQDGATSGSPVKRVTDYGFEIGGPIRKGRAWFWGAYARQDVRVGVLNYYQKTPECAALAADPLAYPIDKVNDCLNPDITHVPTANVKVSLAPFANNRFTWHNSFSAKTKPTRDASDLRPIETTYRQERVTSEYGAWGWRSGPSGVWKARDQHTFGDRLTGEVQWAHVNGGFALLHHSDELRDVQPMYEISTGAWARSYTQSIYVRPSDSVNASLNYLASGLLGGDHAISAGYWWWRGESFTENAWGGNVISRFSSGARPNFSVPYSARFYRDSVTDYFSYSQSMTVQDTYTRKRLTLTAGLRFSYVHDKAAPSQVPASPFMGQLSREGLPFTYLPAVDFAGVEAPGVPRNQLAPTLVAAYDLTGDGRTVVKASFARVQYKSDIYSSNLNPVAQTWVEFPWNDTNGDTVVQMNEVSFSRLIGSGGNFNAADPSSPVTFNQVDPDRKQLQVSEVVVGLDRELAADFGLNASYIWRRYRNGSIDYPFNPTTGVTMTGADWSPVTFTPSAASCPVEGARCDTVTYYTPNFPIPTSYLSTSIPDWYKTFQGFELTLRKRMSHNWMMNASVVLDKPRVYLPSTASRVDPTNQDTLNDGRWFLQTTVLDSVFMDTTWIARVSGAYRLPWQDISVAGFYNARSGYPFVQSIQIASRPNRAGSTLVFLDKIGDVRLDTFQAVDLRVDKTFTIRRAKVQAILDVFNLANASAVLSRRRTQNANNANQISSILAPRVLRIGVRVMF